jgi:hypothetical protein
MLQSSANDGYCAIAESEPDDVIGTVLSTSETDDVISGCSDVGSVTDDCNKSTARKTARTPSDVREISLIN